MITARPAALHRITLVVPDLEAGRAFYRDIWGLVDEGVIDGCVAMRCPARTHADVFLRAAEAGKKQKGMASMGFALRRPEDMPAMIELATRAGAELLRALGPDPLGQGQSALLRGPDGVQMELILPPVREEGSMDPAAQPTKIGHIVLWSTDRPSAEAYYGQLGFKVADRTALGMSFLRCNTDHHSLALADGAVDDLQHLAFEVSSLDDVMQAKGRLARKGAECIWGVGRHGPGRTIFSYYLDPAGNTIEFFTDIEQYEDHDQPLEAIYWGAEHKGDIWGLNGPPPFARN